MNDAVIFSRKNVRGPIAIGTRAAAKNMGVKHSYFGDTDEYENAIIFHNNPSDFPDIDAESVAWWMCDYRKPRTFEKADVDYIFLCNRELLDDYATYFNAETYYMPQPGLPNSWRMRDAKDKVENGIFIGNFTSKYHKNRKDIIDTVSEVTPVLVVSREGQTKDQAGLYREANFCLSISMPFDGYTSNRLYNILSAGGLCLARYFPGIEDLFENGKHLLWFKTADEAVELINEYKTKPEKCDIIRIQGKELYEEKHTAQHRINNMLAIMRGSESEFTGWLH